MTSADANKPIVKKIRVIEQRMPAPYGDIEIDVRPVSIFGKGGVVGHSVGIMDTRQGQGTRSDLDYAEAKAKAVLRAIRAYRRKNDLKTGDPA